MDSFTPLPPPPSSQPTRDLRRLWVGNLDQRVTEFALLNILKPFGSVTQFDLLVHKAGPMKGLPRGYAFVTFETDEQAELAVRKLDGQRLLERRLAVSYAHEAPTPQQGSGVGGIRPNMVVSGNIAGAIASSSVSGNLVSKTKSNSGDVNSQIRAIEAKLKALKERSDSDLTRTLAATAIGPNNGHSLNIAQQINMAAGREGRPGSSMIRNGGFAARHAHRKDFSRSSRPYQRRGREGWR
ncbi:probable RNA-binding protein 18 [Varroa jacobsoni]|uniref:Probable RNA-binding protein 18 n=1 Tax=Varroa destructor TaxID=109461 RepID=A0A7M7KS54_VARDE|nr:probable RNA-binding protein 18 isoform X2 [Varroa destructor]XP_022690199.1 probable RNA-binding protein 18 [Varroa jacobsoni]